MSSKGTAKERGSSAGFPLNLFIHLQLQSQLLQGDLTVPKEI